MLGGKAGGIGPAAAAAACDAATEQKFEDAASSDGGEAGGVGVGVKQDGVDGGEAGGVGVMQDGFATTACISASNSSRSLSDEARRGAGMRWRARTQRGEFAS